MALHLDRNIKVINWEDLIGKNLDDVRDAIYGFWGNRDYSMTTDALGVAGYRSVEFRTHIEKVQVIFEKDKGHDWKAIDVFVYQIGYDIPDILFKERIARFI